MKLHHFALQVKDIDKTILFYTDKLCFTIKTAKTLSEDRKYLYAKLSLPDSDVEIEFIQVLGSALEKKDKSSPPICPHIALESDNLDKDLELLKEKKVLIFDGPHVFPDDVKILTILDPDQYRIDIGQLLKSK